VASTLALGNTTDLLSLKLRVPKHDLLLDTSVANCPSPSRQAAQRANPLYTPEALLLRGFSVVVNTLALEDATKYEVTVIVMRPRSIRSSHARDDSMNLVLTVDLLFHCT
jgi:hypothetical protein